MSLPRIAVSVGCPSGVGPEVSVVAARSETRARVLLVGDEATLRAAAKGRRVGTKRLTRVASPEEAWGLPSGAVGVWQPGEALAPAARIPGRPTRASGAAQLAWVDAACDLVRSGLADAMTTGPVSKEVIASSGSEGAAQFLGHTEHLQRRLGAREVVMAFWSPGLVTSLATTHLSLAQVPAAVTPRAVAAAAFWLAVHLAMLEGGAPRVVVAALNPHAGEGGLLGREEHTCIAPGVARAVARLARSGIAATVEGPVGAETAFRLAVERRWDGVVAMYHDQATIPMKLTGFGDAVNVSLGLPIIRTSVDHGTGYDLAGRSAADARGMQAAIGLAARMVEGRARAKASSRRR